MQRIDYLNLCKQHITTVPRLFACTIQMHHNSLYSIHKEAQLLRGHKLNKKERERKKFKATSQPAFFEHLSVFIYNIHRKQFLHYRCTTYYANIVAYFRCFSIFYQPCGYHTNAHTHITRARTFMDANLPKYVWVFGFKKVKIWTMNATYTYF